MNEFPSRKELIVGGIEAFSGVGYLLGPVIGAPLLASFGFAWCFGISGGLIIILSFVFWCFFPEMTEIKDENED
jgi:MFS family permease